MTIRELRKLSKNYKLFVIPKIAVKDNDRVSFMINNMVSNAKDIYIAQEITIDEEKRNLPPKTN